MFSESIEQLKNQYTDKYVAVDAALPELARFRDLVGQVKTVNMSGRALVEFQDYNLSTGWYDIDLGFLKVVDKPTEEEKAKKAEARKPAAKASPASAPADSAAKPAAKPAAGKKMSVAEMMAAARANKSAGDAPAAKSEAKAKPASPASAGGSPAPAKVDRSKMSVAEMLAAARANKSAGDAPAAPEAAAPPAKPAAKAAPEKPAAPPAAEAPAGEPTKIDRSKMSVAEMLAYARKTDAK